MAAAAEEDAIFVENLEKDLGDALPADSASVTDDATIAALIKDMQGKIPPEAETGTMPRDDLTMKRYLEVHKGDLESAVKLYEENTRWRMTQFKVDSLNVSDVHHQLLTSKMIVSGGKDKEGRPIMHVRPRFIAGSREDTLEVIKLEVYCIEKLLKANPESKGAFTVFLDQTGISIGNFNQRLARAIQETLAYRYPGQVESIIIYSPPAIFAALYTIMKRTLPSSLERIIHMGVSKSELTKTYVDPSQLTAEYGGTLDFDHRKWTRAQFEAEGLTLSEPSKTAESGVTDAQTEATGDAMMTSLTDQAVIDSLEGSTKQGTMKKKGAVVKNWKTRFFVLKGPLLYYYENEKASRPKGCVVLERSLVRDVEDPKTESSDKNAFCVCTATRTWVFIPPTPEDKAAWMKAIGDSI